MTPEIAMKQVGRTEAGKVLFNYLKVQYLNGKVFDTDPLKMAKKAAERDLVSEIVFKGEMKDVKKED